MSRLPLPKLTFQRLLLGLVAISWFVVAPVGAQTDRRNTYEIQRILDRADYTFSNRLMYASARDWVGKTITFRGTIAQRPSAVAEPLPPPLSTILRASR